MRIRYFDHAATTAVDERVLNEMIPYFCENYGNPSSLYSLGEKNREIININRMKIANILNCKVNEIYFTSCGSESNNLILKGIAIANKNIGNHIITTQIEHPAILNTCKTLEKQGFEITYIDVLNKKLNVMDSTATSLCMDNNIPIYVFDVNKKGNLVKAANGEEIGTLVN